MRLEVYFIFYPLDKNTSLLVIIHLQFGNSVLNPPCAEFTHIFVTKRDLVLTVMHKPSGKVDIFPMHGGWLWQISICSVRGVILELFQ